MNTRRAVFGFLAIVSAISGATGCELVGSDRQPLTAAGPSIVEQKPTNEMPDAEAPESAASPNESTLDASEPTPLPGTYEAMCLHYCETLEKTLVYGCLASVHPDNCASRLLGTVAQCVDLRCAPKLVTPSLCLLQCDSLAMSQSSYCKTAQDDASACVAEPAAQSQDCGAGCAVDSS